MLLTDAVTPAARVGPRRASRTPAPFATTSDFYRPENPAIGGLTVLLPYAPPEQATGANTTLLADVEKFAPETKVTAAVIAGYWAADEFVAALHGRARVRARRSWRRPAVVHLRGRGDTRRPTRFPLAHSQPAPCGALVQSDGTMYLPAVTYRCGKPVEVKPSGAGTTGATTTTATKK